MSTQTIAPQYNTNQKKRSAFFSIYSKLNKECVTAENKLNHEIYCMSSYEKMQNIDIQKSLFEHGIYLHLTQIKRNIEKVKKQLKGGDKYEDIY